MGVRVDFDYWFIQKFPHHTSLKQFRNESNSLRLLTLAKYWHQEGLKNPRCYHPPNKKKGSTWEKAAWSQSWPTRYQPHWSRSAWYVSSMVCRSRTSHHLVAFFVVGSDGFVKQRVLPSKCGILKTWIFENPCNVLDFQQKTEWKNRFRW